MADKFIIFEDEHLLVVHKPAGLNTHSPSPFAGEGMYEFLKNRESRWASLAIIHRLDKETSGLLLFGKTALANRSLTQQFSEHSIRKKYFLLTDRENNFDKLIVESALVRNGEKYISRPLHAGSERAETHFKSIKNRQPEIEGEKIQHLKTHARNISLIEAEPVTGKTHQIRVQAAASGFPVLGDTLYGGTAAPRVCLHAAEIIIQHPLTGEKMKFESPVDFSAEPRSALRDTLIDSTSTNAFRLIHGAGDGWPGWYLDKLGDFLLSQSQHPLNDLQRAFLADAISRFSIQGVYHKILNRHLRQSAKENSPQFTMGEKAPDEFLVRENGIQYALSFNEGYSVGLFLDQRENRRRFLTHYIAPEISLFDSEFKVLNLFAYTCAFSVCAARSGAKVTSLDLSKKYLDWGKRNFGLNELDCAKHDFIFGDVFDWLKRFGKEKRLFDVIVLDPPTFSRSKESGLFQAEKDYGKLVKATVPILKSNGILLASTNAATFVSEKFLQVIKNEIISARRKILRQHYVPQPIDFPINREEPAYLKTVWLKIE